MFWLIETEKDLEYLQHRPIQEAFVEIIPYHDHIHPVLNNVSLVYIRPFNDTKGYMLCVDHSETTSLNKTIIGAILQNIERVWVQDKKQALYYFPIKNLCDLSQFSPPYIQNTKAHEHFYFKNTDYPKVNKLTGEGIGGTGFFENTMMPSSVFKSTLALGLVMFFNVSVSM